jgi:hypothetical protein
MIPLGWALTEDERDDDLDVVDQKQELRHVQ